MSIVSVLYADFKRLEEKLHQGDAVECWDEHTYRYFSLLRSMFQHYR